MKKNMPPPITTGDALRQAAILSRKGGGGPCSVYRPTWVEISLPAFRDNVRSVRDRLAPETAILAVVKADAYGHLAVPLARLALKSGAAALGVSSIEEGALLRDAGISAPILILGSLFPLENLAVAARYKLIPTISSSDGLLELVRVARRLKNNLPFHLKIDTGMGRIGITPGTADRLLEKIASLKEVTMAGMYMHFATVDSDLAYARAQFEKFFFVVQRARRRGLRFLAHAANSAALLRYPGTRLDMVRPGLCLYGLLPFPGADKKMGFAPVLSWKTRIVFLKRVPAGTPVSYGRTFIARRPSLIATLPVGYADGYSRSLSNRGEVLIRGERCPVIGRVTMDMIMVDVTRLRGVSIGDEAVLIGAQGDAVIRAEEMAEMAKTINYEVTCAISSRVPRVVVK